VAGDTTDASGTSIATQWKNGTATNLTDGTSYADANAIAVDDSGNAYVGGDTTSASNYSVATYWKNGTPTNLTDGTTDAAVFGMLLSTK
jgi:hypothetical protein